MNVNTPDPKVREAVTRETIKRVNAGEVIEVDLSISAAMVVVTALQIQIREGRFKDHALMLARAVAEHLQGRLSTTPACAEYCQRGWNRRIKKLAHVPTN
jgi:uncharacterized protein YdgA (DUF945 family)